MPKAFLLTSLGGYFYWMDWGFLCCSEQAKEVIKILIHEIIPRFGLPRSLQSDNGPAFKAAVTQGVSKALGIEYLLHCSWRLQSSGKVEKANDIIKRHLCKLTQGTQDNWIKVLPIALMRAHTAPRKGGAVPLWMYLWKAFLTHRHRYRSWSLGIN